MLIVLAIFKYVVAAINPAPFIFYTSILTNLQWFLLLGLALWLLMQLLFLRKMKVPLWWAALILVVLLSLGEWVCSYLLQHAEKVGPNMHAYLLDYYLRRERPLPEATSDCARYDAELGYTYRFNGQCDRSAPEFSDTMYFNIAGLRDDEASLKGPEIICLGDSYTVGTGVGQQQTWPQVLEQTTGMKVLNAGISSYGTARETMLFKRLDTSQLKYIVIQYCFNDVHENSLYAKDGKLDIRTEQEHIDIVNHHKWATKYYPLKRVLTLSQAIVQDKARKLIGRKNGLIDPPGAVFDTSYVGPASYDLVQILYRSGIDFNKVKVIVADMNRYPVFDHHLTDSARIYMQQPQFNDAFRKSVQFIDISKINDQQYYYPLDNHLKAEGHELLAVLIAEELKRLRAASY